MNNIHIFTEVKCQSFSELAKAIERIRQNNSRKPIGPYGGLWGKWRVRIPHHCTEPREALGLLKVGNPLPQEPVPGRNNLNVLAFIIDLFICIPSHKCQVIALQLV